MVNTHSNYRYLRKRLFWEYEVGLIVPIVTRIQFWVEFIVIFRYVRDYRNIRTCFIGKNVIFPGIFFRRHDRFREKMSTLVKSCSSPIFGRLLLVIIFDIEEYCMVRGICYCQWYFRCCWFSGFRWLLSIGWIAAKCIDTLQDALPLFWFSNSLWCSRSCRW